MSDSESSTASNARITKLGLQLGMLAALDSANKPKSNPQKKKVSASAVRIQTRGAVDSARWKKRDAQLEKVNENLKEINTRFSVFDSYLIPATTASDACTATIRATSSPQRGRAVSPPRSTRNSSDLSQRQSRSPRSKSPMLTQGTALEATDAASQSSTVSPGTPGTVAENRQLLKTELRVSSPLRARYQSVLYTQPYEGREPSPLAHTYEIRVAFWSDGELRRMRSYNQSPLRYGIEPASIDLFVPETANPREMLAAVLSHWQWDNLHSFRFVGASAGSDGRSGQCYEGKASESVPDPAAPAMSQFGLYTGAQCLMTYDLSGDNWQWVCTCLKVHVSSDIRITPLSQKVSLVRQCGLLPAQYLWQFDKRFSNYSSKLEAIEDSSRITSDAKGTKATGRDCVEEWRQHEHMAWYDENGKYFESTLAKVVQIFRERYMKRSIADIEQLYQERLARAGGKEGLFF